MSHFSVMVITNEEPTQEVLEQVLLPFHEYECTGIEEYLQDVDVTDKVLEQYNEEVQAVVLADGSYHSRWNDKFYSKTSKDALGFSNKEFELPEGAIEKTLTADDARAVGLGCATMKEAAEDYYGSSVFERDGKWYRKTNPNKQWDWWVRGGRFRGLLLVKQGAYAYEGRGGVFDNGPARENGVDSCRIADLDLEAMRASAGTKAAERWDTVNKAINGVYFKTWEEMRVDHANPEGGGMDAAREAYHAQEAVKACQADEKANELTSWRGPDEYRVSRSKYVQQARDGACATFAVLKDGQWYQRGEMGWWGVVSEEKDKDTWNQEFAKLLDDLPPETWLTVVDCHI